MLPPVSLDIMDDDVGSDDSSIGDVAPSHRPSWECAMAVKALVWFWLIDETLSANLVYQSDYEIGSTIPSDEAMTKIMTMVMAW